MSWDAFVTSSAGWCPSLTALALDWSEPGGGLLNTEVAGSTQKVWGLRRLPFSKFPAAAAAADAETGPHFENHCKFTCTRASVHRDRHLAGGTSQFAGPGILRAGEPTVLLLAVQGPQS